MKRLLVCLLILFGFALAGCEEEYEHHHHPHYAYHDGYHHGGYYGRHYLMNQTTENDGTLQVESAVEP
jgi:hypothetical protein